MPKKKLPASKSPAAKPLQDLPIPSLTPGAEKVKGGRTPAPGGPVPIPYPNVSSR